MKLWARRESLELNENIGSLLYTILKNHVLNEIRHNAIVVELGDDESELPKDGL